MLRQLTYPEKSGDLVSVRAVNGDEDVMIITNTGIIIRIAVENIGIYSRNTQGVKLINVGEDESVAKIAIVDKEEEAEDTAEVSEETVENVVESEDSAKDAVEPIDNENKE